MAFSCGRNDEGQLGAGNNFVGSSKDETQFQVVLDETIVRIGSGPGSQSVFFIGVDGVWAAGANDRNQLGTGKVGSEDVPVPVEFEGPVQIEFVSASGSHTVANGRYI